MRVDAVLPESAATENTESTEKNKKSNHDSRITIHGFRI